MSCIFLHYHSLVILQKYYGYTTINWYTQPLCSPAWSRLIETMVNGIHSTGLWLHVQTLGPDLQYSHIQYTVVWSPMFSNINLLPQLPLSNVPKRNGEVLQAFHEHTTYVHTHCKRCCKRVKFKLTCLVSGKTWVMRPRGPVIISQLLTVGMELGYHNIV